MNNNDRSRIAVVETEVKSVKEEVMGVKKDVKDLKDNHLPHMVEKFEQKCDDIADKVDKKVDSLSNQITVNKNEIQSIAIKVSICIAVTVFILTLVGPAIIRIVFE